MRRWPLVILIVVLFCAAGCAAGTAEAPAAEAETAQVGQADQAEAISGESPPQPEAEEPPESREPASQEIALEPGAGLPDSEFIGREEESPQAAAETDAPPAQPAIPGARQRLVVIDPGHQARANTAQEPVGPGAAEMKMKVSGGTQGVATGVPEYDLVLTVSLLLRDELEARGYDVLLVRETNDVDISNRERAEIANSAGADVFLRIHANGSTDQSVSGAMALCPTANSPYPIAGLYSRCRLLSDCVLDEYTAAAGIGKERVWETDTMSGLNWCQVPVTLLEMGYMSNPAEDRQLNDPVFQTRMVQGIANGVDRYFAELAEGT